MRPDLFAYGSLCAREVYFAVTGVRRRGVPATLRGYRALRVAGQVYPMLQPAPGFELRGLLYRNLSAAELARLDAFEGAWYRRAREAVRVEPEGEGEGEGEGAASARMREAVVRAFVYRCAPSARVRCVDEDWELAPFERMHARAFARLFGNSRRLASLRRAGAAPRVLNRAR